jgi:DNA-binding PadR family transcriptional regulator
MAEQDRPLTDTQRGVLQVATNHGQISQSRLATHPATLDLLVRYGYLERIQVPYSEPYFRITDSGRAVLQTR